MPSPFARLRLTFPDPALERDWWIWFAAERARVMRSGAVVLLGAMVLFIPFDREMYPETSGKLLVIRLFTLALMLLAVPSLFGPRSKELLADHGQELILYVCLVTLTGLAAIGWVVAPVVTDERAYAPLMALCLTVAGLYSGTGLRFRYAAPLSLFVTALFALVVELRAHPPPGYGLAVLTFGVGVNVLGLVVSWSMEHHGRRAFQRARELDHERRRSQALLLNVMPRAYAERLAAGGGACVDRLPDATVLFATVVGFDEATADHPPIQIVVLLDRLVATFDALATVEGVERIKTIGATYMAAAGVTGARADHAEAATRLALALRDATRNAARREGLQLQLRVGVCSGPLVAGVIGRTRFAFDCWGDTANVAARLDGSGEPDRVQVSASTAAKLGAAYVIEPRGAVLLKGKGAVETFWVERAEPAGEAA
ncbi:MAG: adenylate/guanylate cyclase domain-containing protein [Pseudomonadota bacterium]|nr:adenylate/guanylate cyclase domain-containing protein [Pseudomonadota bacterium]